MWMTIEVCQCVGNGMFLYREDQHLKKKKNRVNLRNIIPCINDLQDHTDACFFSPPSPSLILATGGDGSRILPKGFGGAYVTLLLAIFPENLMKMKETQMILRCLKLTNV